MNPAGAGCCFSFLFRTHILFALFRLFSNSFLSFNELVCLIAISWSASFKPYLHALNVHIWFDIYANVCWSYSWVICTYDLSYPNLTFLPSVVRPVILDSHWPAIPLLFVRRLSDRPAQHCDPSTKQRMISCVQSPRVNQSPSHTIYACLRWREILNKDEGNDILLLGWASWSFLPTVLKHE